jgi:hypothetical protein
MVPLVVDSYRVSFATCFEQGALDGSAGAGVDGFDGELGDGIFCQGELRRTLAFGCLQVLVELLIAVHLGDDYVVSRDQLALVGSLLLLQ